MAENVLRRRDEYEEKKEHRYGVVKKTAAIAVTVVFVLSAMIVGPIVGRIMKEQQNQPADGTKINTDTETTADQDTITTETADVTTEVGETTGEIDETTEKNKYFLPIEYLPDPNPAITLEVTESSESSPFVRYYGYDKSEIKTYQMRYNNTTYFNSMSMNGEGSHGNYVKIIITSSENIEMLTDNYLVLEIPGATADFELSFKCINGATNGFFTIYWIEDTHDYYDEIDENTDIDAFRLELRKNGRKEYISRENRTYGFANVKGYDIFAKCETVDHIYSVVARYFGEVDANGVPLYLTDPYMPDYYDSLHSQNDRLIKEKIQLFEFVSPNAPKFESDVFDSYDKPMKYTKMYAYDEKDIMEYNVKVNVKEVFNMRNPDYKFSKLKVYVAHDDNVEILTGKYQEFDMSSGDAEFKLSFRYINGAKNEMFLLFYSTDKDAYYNDLNETTVLKNGFDTNGELNRRYQMFAFCTIRLKGYDFTAAIAYQNLVMNMYKSVAYYFNDVDANNRPLYLDNPAMEGYSDSPWCKSILNPTDPLENEEIREKIREYFDTADDKTKQDIEGILEEYETSKQ